MKHTQGAWTANREHPARRNDAEIIVSSGSGHPLATLIADGLIPISACIANACLMAMAPVLLEELQNIANANPKNWDVPYNDTASFQEWAQSRARAVIAKVAAQQSSCATS